MPAPPRVPKSQGPEGLGSSRGCRYHRELWGLQMAKGVKLVAQAAWPGPVSPGGTSCSPHLCLTASASLGNRDLAFHCAHILQCCGTGQVCGSCRETMEDVGAPGAVALPVPRGFCLLK